MQLLLVQLLDDTVVTSAVETTDNSEDPPSSITVTCEHTKTQPPSLHSLTHQSPMQTTIPAYIYTRLQSLSCSVHHPFSKPHRRLNILSSSNRQLSNEFGAIVHVVM